MQINFKSQPESGFVLLLTLVIVSIVLAIGLSMLHITLKQLTLSNIARESEVAFHAASTGIECMQFHRAHPRTRSVFLSAATAPSLDCADSLPVLAETGHEQIVSPNALLNNYQYRHSVDGDKCVETSLYMMDLQSYGSDVVDHDISSNDEGLTSLSCEAGSVCTTIFSRGYNRPCDSLDSIFTVQRELTIEY